MKEKGIDELFAAMRQLNRAYGNRVILDLVGFYDDDFYQRQVDELVSAGIAVFHGFQTDPLPYYASTDCVVLPSYHEGMSNVLLEAAAIGRPVITSNIPGCREAVEHEKTGLLCTVKDTKSLYEQMRHMVTIPIAERSAMGQAAHEKMVREFDKRNVVSATIAAALGLAQ